MNTPVIFIVIKVFIDDLVDEVGGCPGFCRNRVTGFFAH
jgi:hypothetical protein